MIVKYGTCSQRMGTSNTRSSWNSDFPWNMIFSILYMCASPVQFLVSLVLQDVTTTDSN